MLISRASKRSLMFPIISAGHGKKPIALSRRSCVRSKDRQFLRFCNFGSEAMREEDQARVRAISNKYRWRDVEGRDAELLTADEIRNLTIRSGTLNEEERQIINHHIEVTI